MEWGGAVSIWIKVISLMRNFMLFSDLRIFRCPRTIFPLDLTVAVAVSIRQVPDLLL